MTTDIKGQVHVKIASIRKTAAQDLAMVIGLLMTRMLQQDVTGKSVQAVIIAQVIRKYKMNNRKKKSCLLLVVREITQENSDYRRNYDTLKV